MHRNTDGARLVGNRAGNRLANPPCRISRKFVATTIFELIHRLHQTDIAFLNQIKELQTTVGVFFGNGNHQAQVRLNHFLLGRSGFFFAFHHVFADFFQLGNRNPRVRFQFRHFGLLFQNIVFETRQGFAPYAVFADFLFQPFQIGGVRHEVFDEIVAVHAHAVQADVADFAFQPADLLDTAAQVFAQIFNLACGKTHFQQFLRNIVAVFQIRIVLAVVLVQSLHHQAVAFFDVFEVLQHLCFELFQILLVFQAAGIGIFVIFAAVFVIFAAVAFFGRMRAVVFQMSQAQFVEQHFVRVDNGFDHFINTDFVFFHLVDQRQNFAHGTRAGGNGLNHVFQGIFDFFGNFDFVFAREQLHLPHFAHIHPHGVGGAAEFGICLRQRGFGFGNGVFVRHGTAVVAHQQRVGIGRFFGHLNAQALNHVHHAVNMLGIGHIVRQCVVDFGIGDIAALFALQNQAAQSFALLFGRQGAVAVELVFGFVIGIILWFGHGLLVFKGLQAAFAVCVSVWHSAGCVK